MLKVGLTGGIGSGKSIVAGIFEVLGIPVFDADSQAKRLMNTNDQIKKLLIKEFGTDTYKGEELNRSLLSNLVFNDPYKLERLNAIVHPITIAAAETWMQQQTSAYVIKEAALLFEAGSTNHLDYIIGVFAPLNVRIQRVIKRDKLTGEAVRARMNRQIQDEIKMKLCDFVLTNDEQHLLIPQIISLHEKLLSFASDKQKN
jgi:dephospho-CoA kinase